MVARTPADGRAQCPGGTPPSRTGAACAGPDGKAASTTKAAATLRRVMMSFPPTGDGVEVVQGAALTADHKARRVSRGNDIALSQPPCDEAIAIVAAPCSIGVRANAPRPN